MPDNVTYQAVTPATPPAGTVAATDEVQVDGTNPIGHVQFVKLVDGSLNGTSPIPGDKTNGLDVDITRTVPPLASTAARTSVAGAISSTSLIAANAARRGLVLVNDSDADLYVGLGAVAVSTSDYSYFLPKQANGQKSQMELPQPIFTGELRGIWSSATGNVRVTELT